MSAFAGTIEQVTDSLAELLKPDSVAILIELAELRVRFKPKRNSKVKKTVRMARDQTIRFAKRTRSAVVVVNPLASM